MDRIDLESLPYDLRTKINSAVTTALSGDIGSGDVTTKRIIPTTSNSEGRLLAKEEGILAGLAVACQVFLTVDDSLDFEPLLADGQRIKTNDTLAYVRGATRSILTAERTALNFLQRMSGIATLTRHYVEAVRGTHAMILDTRKTAPGLRELDKWAVRLGGGKNHRMGLYDMVLIKDNHIAAAGGITAAVKTVWANQKLKLPIEVEVSTLKELKEVLTLDVDRILLDNMSPQMIRKAVELVGARIALEASGKVTLATVRKIAETGVNYISVGELTHSSRAVDISLDLAIK
jgi:nicotinate-nucleotide pyrophosphorylase (carboxylating)